MIICADDYGLREDIDEAILELCGARKLSAVSCMAALRRCDAAAMTRLLKHQSHVDVGLHLCLTDEGLPLSFSESTLSEQRSFSVLLRRALLGQVRPQDVYRLVSIQYELFVQKSGRTPSHIDGHLHAHQLSSVRRGLLDFVLSLAPANRPYIRNTQLAIGEVRRRGLPWRKAALIGWFGARMKRSLRTAGVQTNEGFAGIYEFADWRRYPEYLPKFAASLHDANGILVVHPGLKEEWRKQECAALRAASLGAIVNRFQLQIEADRPGLSAEECWP